MGLERPSQVQVQIDFFSCAIMLKCVIFTTSTDVSLPNCTLNTSKENMSYLMLFANSLTSIHLNVELEMPTQTCTLVCNVFFNGPPSCQYMTHFSCMSLCRHSLPPTTINILRQTNKMLARPAIFLQIRRNLRTTLPLTVEMVPVTVSVKNVHKVY